MLPLVSIAITNWNGKKYCLDCLKSILLSSYPPKLLEVILVDNASTDGSVEAVKERFPWVKILKQTKNLGFSAGINEGFKKATGKYILVLNNDVVLEKDYVKELVEVAEKSENIGIVGGKVYSFSKSRQLQSLWGWIDRKLMHVIHPPGTGEIDRGQFDKNTEVDYVPFLCLIRKKVLQKVGYLDERYFSTYEDTDLMIRVKDAGYKIIFCPKAVIKHKGAVAFGSGSPRLTYYLQRNSLLIRDKFNSFSLLDHLKNMRFLFTLFISSLLTKKKREHWAALRGVLDFYRGKFGPAPDL